MLLTGSKEYLSFDLNRKCNFVLRRNRCMIILFVLNIIGEPGGETDKFRLNRACCGYGIMYKKKRFIHSCDQCEKQNIC